MRIKKAKRKANRYHGNVGVVEAEGTNELVINVGVGVDVVETAHIEDMKSEIDEIEDEEIQVEDTESQPEGKEEAQEENQMKVQVKPTYIWTSFMKAYENGRKTNTMVSDNDKFFSKASSDEQFIRSVEVNTIINKIDGKDYHAEGITDFTGLSKGCKTMLNLFWLRLTDQRESIVNLEDCDDALIATILNIGFDMEYVLARPVIGMQDSELEEIGLVVDNKEVRSVGDWVMWPDNLIPD